MKLLLKVVFFFSVILSAPVFSGADPDYVEKCGPETLTTCEGVVIVDSHQNLMRGTGLTSADAERMDQEGFESGYSVVGNEVLKDLITTLISQQNLEVSACGNDIFVSTVRYEGGIHSLFRVGQEVVAHDVEYENHIQTTAYINGNWYKYNSNGNMIITRNEYNASVLDAVQIDAIITAIAEVTGREDSRILESCL